MMCKLQTVADKIKKVKYRVQTAQEISEVDTIRTKEEKRTEKISLPVEIKEVIKARKLEEETRYNGQNWTLGTKKL